MNSLCVAFVPNRVHTLDSRWRVFNTFGNIAGIVGPALAGILAQRFGNFWWAFALAASLSIVGGAAWVFVVGPITQIRWFPEAVPVAA